MFFLSYVEDTLEHNKAFDAEGLLASGNSFEGRLKFWTKRLCAERPQTFDIVLAVRILQFYIPARGVNKSLAGR